jgi:hypothetical protein
MFLYKNKIMISLLILFLMFSLVVGCAKTRIYTSNEISTFEKDIKLLYPHIEKFQVRRRDIGIHIYYTITDPLSRDEVKELVEITKEFVKSDDFINSISKADKSDIKTFSRAYVRVIYPNPDKENVTRDAIYGIE